MSDLVGILRSLVATLHDASQVCDDPERGHYNTHRVAPLLAIIGDAVECPDCAAWDEQHAGGTDLTDDEVVAALSYDAEAAAEDEAERRLRERP